MIADRSLTLNWEALLAVTIVTLALLFVVVLLLVRAQRSKRMRVGVFVEREMFDADDDPPPT